MDGAEFAMASRRVVERHGQLGERLIWHGDGSARHESQRVLASQVGAMFDRPASGTRSPCRAGASPIAGRRDHPCANHGGADVVAPSPRCRLQSSAYD
jgi:hypothetical protein